MLYVQSISFPNAMLDRPQYDGTVAGHDPSTSISIHDLFCLFNSNATAPLYVSQDLRNVHRVRSIRHGEGDVAAGANEALLELGYELVVVSQMNHYSTQLWMNVP